MILSKAAALSVWKDHLISLWASMKPLAMPWPSLAFHLVLQPVHPVLGKAELPVHPRSQGKTSLERSPCAGIPGQHQAVGRWDVCQSCRARNKQSRKKPQKKKASKKKKANTYLSPKETNSAQKAGFGGAQWKCGEFAIYTPNDRRVFLKLLA